MPLLWDEDLHDILGLAPGEQLEQLDSIEPPATSVAEGFTMARADPSLPAGLPDELLAAIAREPHAQRDERITRHLPAGEALRWDLDPRVLLLDGVPNPVVASGAVGQAVLHYWVLDTRAERSVVLLGTTERIVLQARHGAIRVAAVRAAQQADAPQDVTWLSEHAIQVPAPEEILGEFSTAPWLLERARGLHGSAALFDRVAAAGLLARMASAAAPRPRQALEAMLSGSESAAARVTRWARGLDAAALDAVEHLLLEEAADLGDAIAALAEIVADAPGEAHEAAETLCTRRDDLESVALVLGAAGRSSSARSALATVDRRAHVHLTSFDLAGAIPDSELLAAVWWQQPDAWWGWEGERAP